MKFISAEEFLKQDEDVQRVFADYFEHKEMLFEDGSIYFGPFDYLYTTPLLTEGDLREFIEDKTKDIVLFDCDDLGNNKNWYIHKTCKAYDVVGNENLGDDLLQAYWKIAIEIAKCQTSVKGYKNRW